MKNSDFIYRIFPLAAIPRAERRGRGSDPGFLEYRRRKQNRSELDGMQIDCGKNGIVAASAVFIEFRGYRLIDTLSRSNRIAVQLVLRRRLFGFVLFVRNPQQVHGLDARLPQNWAQNRPFVCTRAQRIFSSSSALFTSGAPYLHVETFEFFTIKSCAEHNTSCNGNFYL